MSFRALFNGRSQAPDLRRSRALHYGDGVFRTCLIHEYECLELEGHLDKLLADAAVLGLDPPRRSLLRREAKQLAAGARTGVIKLLLIRAGQGRGYAPTTAAADRLLMRFDAPRYPASFWARGVRLERAGIRLGTQPQLAGVKHLNRLEQVLALRAGPRANPRHVAEVLLGDQQGRPLSGARSNLFWVRRGVLYTPLLDCCGVAGLTRARILQLARRAGIPLRQVRGSWSAVERADEVFVCNSLIGIWPARRLGRRRWPAPGAITQRLMQDLVHPIPGSSVAAA